MKILFSFVKSLLFQDEIYTILQNNSNKYKKNNFQPPIKPTMCYLQSLQESELKHYIST